MSSKTSASVQVRTTLPIRPLPPNTERAAIVTERLTIRPFRQDDLHGYHLLRTQPEVMLFTAVGCIDKDLAETQSKLDLFLAPNDAHTYNFAICILDTGELIGVGGVHKMKLELGWPEVGYMLKREYWGKGYATEFLRGFVGSWWRLERQEAVITIDGYSVDVDKETDGQRPAPEYLTAIIDANNEGSLRVLEKTGFRKFKTWTEPDSRIGYEGKDITLIRYLLGQE
ncbi:hypothetical protein PFICI_06217 [Pestalotiopsis fici W106-1]|uniref:N-acetyltransferase domain-containing protein n=1 Tax=Pestalotiopsis fici (strain W106-1 / CGMCC3.15140) TaxID=1229662 RepID=W3X585_PESFW|nr:uncharacterized protein PFICI_06217 [Pestalotiopsis fici W106-1]ETS81215.1 hypothetical protein PFICI_06217 [Pestalotiopsis fici W106-1]